MTRQKWCIVQPTLTFGMSAVTFLMMSTRSSIEKKGRLLTLTITATVSESYIFAALRIMLRCPFVIGSNDPAYTAVLRACEKKSVN